MPVIHTKDLNDSSNTGTTTQPYSATVGKVVAKLPRKVILMLVSHPEKWQPSWIFGLAK